MNLFYVNWIVLDIVIMHRYNIVCRLLKSAFNIVNKKIQSISH